MIDVGMLRCAWPDLVAKTWLDIVIWMSGLGSVVCGIWQIRRKNEIARAEMLRKVLEEYNGRPIRENIQAIDDEKIVFSKGNNFKVGSEQDKSVSLAEPALLFFSNLCYLRRVKLLTKKEFSFFEWRIRKVMADQSVRNYVKNLSANDKDVAMTRLLDYCD